jgi:hemolysin D
MSSTLPANASPLPRPRRLTAQTRDFVPGLLAIQESPPARMPRVVAILVGTLFFVLLGWSLVGRLDIVASADGRLVPQSYVKIVQPADAGIVHEILVTEGQRVAAGQVLVRMDARDALADTKTLAAQKSLRSLQLRRIDAELGGRALARQADDPDDLFRQVQAQLADRLRAHADAVGQAQEARRRAERDYDSGKEVLAKLQEVEPILRQQADSFKEMGQSGFVSKIQMQDKERDHLEKLRDLKAQQATVAGLEAGISSAGKQLAELESKYRSDLQGERLEAEEQYRKLEQELVKQDRRTGLMALRAPQAGVVKDLATHTVGTVVSPGAVLLSLVPDQEALMAEVMVRNDDVAFVYPGQRVKLKLAAFPFQEYGMVEGKVLTVGADSTEPSSERNQAPTPPSYKAIVALDSQRLQAGDKSYPLVAGMQATAEIDEGRRTVMQYLLSPVSKTLQESAKER